MRGRLSLWLGATVLSGAVGAAYAAAIGGTPQIGGVIGTGVGGSVVGFELFIVQQRAGRWLRRLPLPTYIAVTTLAWLVVIALWLQLVPRIMLGEAYGHGYKASTFGQDLGFGFLVSVVFNSAIRIRTLVGPRVLTNFLLGRYHRPLREERVFMFLDLAGSTQLSEQLGDERVQSLIGQFFFDIAAPIARYRGETHRYIGDEIVVTWPLQEAVRGAACITCVLEIKALMSRRAERYRARFGVVPRFRVGMHGGSVVASEVGDEKREIVYFGDTVNTAARLQAACKDLGRDFLVSESLLSQLTLPDGVGVERLGPIRLAGKAEPTAVAAVG